MDTICEAALPFEEGRPSRTLRGVFDEYRPQRDIDFVRTRFAARLTAEADGPLVSRSDDVVRMLRHVGFEQ
jgi:hypothetical protein